MVMSATILARLLADIHLIVGNKTPYTFASVFRIGARHWNPLRFDLAWHLNAWCISKSMGLSLRFFARPHPLGRGVDVADNRLAPTPFNPRFHRHDER
jgi:hypothetical protein